MKIKKIAIIFTIIIITFIFKGYSFAENNNVEDVFQEVTAPNVLVGETNTGKIIYEKNIEEKIYPASITKLMTAILVVENCELDEIVTVSENAVTSVPSGYVNANLQVGEEITVEDLLYVMLIPSANDAANALAEHVAGSIDSFSTMMNTKAKEIGCTGSNFTNPSGLHQEEHYTTTKDLFLISRVAFSNNIIKKIIGTTNYTLPQTNKYNETKRMFTTTNYIKRKDLKKYYYNYCIGAKTGYTEYAKNCVVAFAMKDEIGITTIIMGEDAKVKGKKFLEAKKLFEYIYNNYENKNIFNKNSLFETIKIKNGTKDTKKLDVLVKQDIKILENKNKNIDIKNIESKVKYTKNKAPINSGDIIGHLVYNYDGIEYETDLIAGKNVEESKSLGNLLKILIIFIIIYIIYNYKNINNKHKKYGKKYKKSERLYYR